MVLAFNIDMDYIGLAINLYFMTLHSFPSPFPSLNYLFSILSSSNAC